MVRVVAMERFSNNAPPGCRKCGKHKTRLAALPKMGLHPLTFIYKCVPCARIRAIKPDELLSSTPSDLFNQC